MNGLIVRSCLAMLLPFCLGGCISHAPITTSSASISLWRAPLVAPAATRRLAIARPVGPPEVARQLEAEIATAISRSRTELDIVTADQLSTANPIRQVSAQEATDSDIEALLAARHAGCDLLLFGEILPDPMQARLEKLQQQRTDDDRETPPVDDLRIAWRLIDVKRNETLGRDAQRHQRPPPTSQSWLEALAEAASSEKPACHPAVAKSAAEGALRLVTPFVEKTDIELAKPWLAGGARRVREGNAAAAAGDWPTAERVWRTTLDNHPGQHAAVHNLAYAALAREDYPTARRLAREATRLAPKQLYERSAVWIESQWREAHTALGVPPPEGGWYFAPPPKNEPD